MLRVHFILLFLIEQFPVAFPHVHTQFVHATFTNGSLERLFMSYRCYIIYSLCFYVTFHS